VAHGGALGERAAAAVAAVRLRSGFEPRVGIVLGTGLGGLAEEIDVETSLSYAEIPGFPEPTVDFHEGRLLLGTLAGTPVAALQGRLHRYEGHALQDVVFPVRILWRLGAGVLLVSGACGGLNLAWAEGDLVLLEDHINLMGENPLVGPNDEAWGPRFPDMSEPYDRALQDVALSIAEEQGISLRRGVYAAVTGPNLETRAEYRMLRTLGADVVGMSTVPEVIVARHMGMRVLGVSIITDRCDPDALEPADIDRILSIARNAEPNLTRLLSRLVGQL
jgi:purine-nucleoside phosphorylase